MSRYITLSGSNRTLLPSSRPAGPVDKTELASLTIRVRPKNDPARLEQLILKESSKSLKQRTYLTLDEIEQQYGAAAEDLDAIEQLAQEHDLMVVHRNAVERSVVVRGTLGDLLNTFPANVHIYHHSSGTYRGREGEIKIPRHLDGIVTGDARRMLVAPRIGNNRARNHRLLQQITPQDAGAKQIFIPDAVERLGWRSSRDVIGSFQVFPSPEVHHEPSETIRMLAHCRT